MIKRRISALFLHIVKAMPLALVLLFALKPVFADTSFYPAGSTLMCNYDEFGETDSVVFDAVWCQECSEDALRTTTCQLNVDETAGTCSYTGMCKEGYITLENPATANMYCVVNPVNYEIHYNNMFDGWFVDSVSNPSSFNVETPDIILGPAARNGYNFVAWYSDYNSANSHGSTNIVSIIPTGSTGNKELYAGWDIITYELTYDLDGGSLLANNPLTYNVTTPSFQLNNPTKLGYDFAGWCSIVADACVEGEPVVNYSINIGSYGDKDMRAFWSPTEYTITYEYGGGSVSSANRDSYTLETPTFTINNPERTGYTFGGWCEDSETCNNPLMTYTITMGTTGNKHLFAVWTPINYTITYALDGGTETTPNRTSYNIETPTFVLNNPTKSGYTFIGWCEGDSGCQYPNTSYQVTRGNTGNKTLYARWGAQTYHITYTLNGGVANPAGNPTEYSVLTPTFTINNPTRTGFEFDGWCEGGSSCSNPVKNYEIVQGSSGDRNLYARWKSRKFTLIYKCETTATSISNPEYNENFIAVFPDCTKTGYTFDEWTCLRTDNNVNVTEHIYDYVNIGVWDIDSNVVCTGNWEENSYSITYKYVDDNDNDVLINGMSPTSVTFTELSEGVDISGNPTRLGYTFVSWCNDRNRTECQYPLPIQYNGSESTLVSRIIWALWRLTDYTITYNTNGGQNNPNNPDSYNIKSETFMFQNPTRDGYTFRGWYENASFTGNRIYGIAKGSNTTGNKELYAKWDTENYSITYVLNGGDEFVDSDEVVYEYGFESDDITLPTPTRTGYDFAGWYLNSGFNGAIQTILPHGSTGNKTYYAKWTPINYNVNYSCRVNEGSVRIDTIAYNDQYSIRPSSLCPDREGYINAGWSCKRLNNDNSVYGNISETLLNTSAWHNTFNVLCDAVWEPIHYQVIFEQNGGTQQKSNITCTYDEPCDLTNNNEIVRQGYVFVGWSTDSSSTTAVYAKPSDSNEIIGYNLSSTNNANVYLYAVWRVAQIQCANGYYLPMRKTECSLCKPGFYCPANSWYYNEFSDQGNLSCAFLMNVDKATSEEGSYQESDCKAYCPSRRGYVVTQTYNYGETSSACVYNGTIHYENVDGCSDVGYTYPTDANVVLCSTTQNRVGRIFKGFRDDKGTEYLYNGSTIRVRTETLVPVDNVVTMTGIWQDKTYTIKYNCNTSVTPADETADYGTEVNLYNYNNCRNTGSTFAGWECIGDATLTQYDTLENKLLMPDENVSCSARWSTNSYTINFVGGSGTTGSTPSMTSVAYGGQVKLNKNGFKKRGYKFIGWCTDWNSSTNKCVGSAFADEAVVSNLTQQNSGVVNMYAMWNLNSYNIMYMVNGKSTNIGSLKIYDINTQPFVVKNINQNGVRFDGWCFGEADCDIPQVDYEFNVDDLPEELTDVVLYAKTAYIPYTIKYKDVGADNVVYNITGLSPTSYNVTEYVNLPTNIDVSTHHGVEGHTYSFGGWYTDPEFTSARQTAITTGNTRDIELYAKWTDTTPMGSIRYVCSSNSSNTETYYYGTILNSLPTKSYCGLTYNDEHLSGWTCANEYYAVASDDDGSIENAIEINSNEITCTANITYDKSNITYNKNGGDWSEGFVPKTEYTRVEFVSLPRNITKTGYEFAGWYEEADLSGTVVSYINIGTNGDKNFYAKWTPKNITCSRGTYLKKQETTCTACDEANKYCNGGTFTYDPEHDQGKEACPEDYPNAVAGADSIEKCYTSCPAKEGYEYASGVLYRNNNQCVYTPIPSNITYHKNGGEFSSEPRTKYTSEEFVSLPTNITKSGYSFGGWYEEADLSGTVVSYINIGTNGDKNFYAKWTPKSITCSKGKYLKAGDTSCTTTCDEANKYCNGGTFTYDPEHDQGKEACPEEYPNAEVGADSIEKCYTSCPAKEGYEYASGVLYRNNNQCVYTPKTYNISYVLNGGTWDEGTELVNEFVVGVPLTQPLPEPILLNRTFANWTDIAGNIVETIDTNTTDDIVLYATWNIGPCAENYYFVNGDCSVCPTGAKSSGGYATQCECGDYYELDNGVCKPITYTITYVGLNGANNPNPTTYTVEDVGTLLVAPSRRAGYQFSKWTRKGKTFTELRAGLGDITLTANWSTLSVTCPEGAYLPAETEECVPCEDGYYCPGGTYYYDDEDIGLRQCEAPYTNSHDATNLNSCFASCPEDTSALRIEGGIYRNGDNTCAYVYSIEYETNGGTLSGVYPHEYVYNSNTIELPTPVKSGYEFNGWYLTENYVGGALQEFDTTQNRGPVTLYAKWIKECTSGVRLYVGDDTAVCLLANTTNRPALAIKVGTKTYYLDMTLDENKTISTETTKKMRVEHNGEIYNIHSGIAQ